MCKYTREIVVGSHTMRIPCGHCEECLQDKAMHNAQLIRDSYDEDTTVLFVTLTYHNDCIPYVAYDDSTIFDKPNEYGSEFGIGDEVSVFRNSTSRFVSADFGSSDVVLQRKIQEVKLGTFINHVPFTPNKHKYLRCYNKLDKYKYHHRIGVLWYADVQNFIKKLRQIVLRENIYENYFQVYYVGEYGETTHRPHFHVLLFLKALRQDDFKKWKYACGKAWTFDDSHRTFANTEVARKPASYVGSYISCNTFIPLFLRQKPIAPKARHSKFFGLAPLSFSASSVTEKVERRNIVYNVRRVGKNVGVSDTPVCLPEYVVRTYFPKIKGYSRLTSDEVFDVYQQPAHLSAYAKKLGYSERINVCKDSSGRQLMDSDGCQKLQYINDLKHNKSVINAAFSRWFNGVYGFPVIDSSADEYYLARARYASLVASVWKLRQSYIIKSNLKRVKSSAEWIDIYDNWDEFKIKPAYAITQSSFPYSVRLVVASSCQDPNKQETRLRRAALRAEWFYKSSKEHKIKNKFLADDWQNNNVYV